MAAPIIQQLPEEVVEPEADPQYESADQFDESEEENVEGS